MADPFEQAVSTAAPEETRGLFLPSTPLKRTTGDPECKHQPV